MNFGDWTDLITNERMDVGWGVLGVDVLKLRNKIKFVARGIYGFRQIRRVVALFVE